MASNKELLTKTYGQNNSFYIKELLYAKKQELQEKLEAISKNKDENTFTESTSESFLVLKIEQLDKLIEYINRKSLSFERTDLYPTISINSEM